MIEKNNTPSVSKEKLIFANTSGLIKDRKFEDKPIGYFRDAWGRFCKNKASIVAAFIILAIFLFALLVPLLNFNYDSTFMDPYYAKKGPKSESLRWLGFDGGTERALTEKGLIRILAIGAASEHVDGNTEITLGDSMESEYQPLIELGDISYQLDPATRKDKAIWNSRIDAYLEVGFLYMSIEQHEYQRIVDWENATGKKVLYPIVEDNEFNVDSSDANNWYKSIRYQPVKTNANGVFTQEYSEDLVLEDNYKRDDDGNLIYKEYYGGGNMDTAQYRIRVLYRNYYEYKNGFAPKYIMGTDSQGYDLALRMAEGVRLSLLIAVLVSVINLVLGAMYGAVEGYYGGGIDLVLERVSDVLSGVPFIVVATLFQIHLASKVGTIPSLLFAFVVTGWIGTASRVRTQFYRFKNQEYVMAARTLGARDKRIIWKHIFPNTLGTIITSSILVIPSVIFSESMLSFLGIVNLGGSGVTSLGTLLSDASSIWTNYPHLMIFPALIIALLMVSFNLFGNGLRDAFNPSLRGAED